jgi:hypothetical protein
MILSRVIEHVRKQHWTAVFLDFVIVVLGVFVGLQVNNWNAARQRAADSRIYTERLLRDVRAEAHYYVVLEGYMSTVLDNGQAILAVLENGAEMSDADFLVHAYRATQYSFTIGRRATFDELVASSRLDLITDNNLRETALIYYPSTWINDAMRNWSASPYRTLFRSLAPSEMQSALAEQCGDRPVGPETVDVTLDYPCAFNMPADQIAAVAQALRNDPRLLETLRVRVANISTDLHNLSDNKPFYGLDKFVAPSAPPQSGQQQ